MINTVEQALEKVRKFIADNCKEFICMNNCETTKQMVYNFISTVKSQLQSIYGNDAPINFRIKTSYNGNVEILPQNLFTLLLFNGIQVSPLTLKDEDSYETDIGTFIFKNGQGYLKFKKPVDFIKIDVKFKPKYPNI